MTNQRYNEAGTTFTNKARRKIRDYYDKVGWKFTSNGLTIDAAANVDQGLVVGSTPSKPRGFPRKGRYLLDAGCGANPRTLLSQGFYRHICLDFSIRGLFQAFSKLGRKGIAVLGDVTRLPFADNSFDAINCDHTLYHLVPSDQVAALTELYRVLSPGGELWISYTMGSQWLVTRLFFSVKNALRGIPPLLRMVRWLRQLTKKGNGLKKEFASLDGSVYTGAPIFEPCSLDWWKDMLQKKGMQFTFESIRALSANTTRMFPKFFAYVRS